MTPEPELTPEAVLLEQSRELDEQMAGNTELLALRHVVAANAVIIGRLRSQRRALFLLWGMTLVLSIVGIAIATDVRNNSEKIDRASEAVQIFCQQTNASNAEAQAKFRQTFPQAGADDQLKLEKFLDAGWPIHDCSAADKSATTSTVSDPSESTTSIKETIP